MRRRQTRVPRQWLIADVRMGGDIWRAVRKAPHGSGILLLHRDLGSGERARLKSKLRIASLRRHLVIADEAAGEAARVHDPKEIRQAALRDVPILFLSPLFPTRSHPDRTPLTKMRAAALLRLADAPVVALGGVNARRFGLIERLGFQGWAGIDAWRRRKRRN